MTNVVILLMQYDIKFNYVLTAILDFAKKIMFARLDF